MPSQVFAHVGLPKTGTTYLQNLLYANADAFASQGVTVVGSHPLHFDAASELTGFVPRRRTTLPVGRWEKVVELVDGAATDRVVISNERYSLTTAEATGRMAHDLGADRLHLVVTVRDFVAAEPSAWQEYVKNGGTDSWADYCAVGVAEPAVVRERRRIRQLLELWDEHLPSERIHLVTVPPEGSDRDLIVRRFCSVLGVDPGAVSLVEPTRRNTSLDFVATEMIRRLNAREPRLSIDAQRAEIKQWLAGGVLAQRSGTERPVLTGAALEIARAENAWLLDRIGERGYHVVGDLSDLAQQQPAGATNHDVTPEVLLDAALEALALMAERSFDRGREVRRLRKAVDAGELSPGPARRRGLLRRRG